MDSKEEEDVDRGYKIVLLGDSEVGKTSLINRYLRDNFIVETIKTLSVEISNKLIDVFGPIIELALWDSSGQEIYRGILTQLYRKAAAVVLIYDVANRSSFESLKRWIEELARYSSVKDAVKVIIGNKIDLNREVSLDEGTAFAKKHNMEYLETSAKDSIDVAKAFEFVAFEILEKRASLQLNTPSPEEEKSSKRIIPRKPRTNGKNKPGTMNKICFCCSSDTTI